MAKVNRTSQQDLDRKLIAAIHKHLANQAAIVIAGVSYTPPTLATLIEHDATVADAATNARAALLAASAAARDQRATMKPLLAGLRAYVQNQFTDPTIIAEFGFPPRTVKTPTAATAALAVEKRKATRKARSTMGKLQKAGIHGTVASTAPVTSGTQAPPVTPPSPTVTPGGPGGTVPSTAPVTPAPVTSAPAATH